MLLVVVAESIAGGIRHSVTKYDNAGAPNSLPTANSSGERRVIR